MKNYAVLFVVCLIGLYSCKKPGGAKAKPEIGLTGLSHNIVTNGSLKDTVLISLRYTIAASGIGVGTSPTEVFFKDSRDANSLNRLPFPEDIASNLPESEVNISGAISIKVPASLYLVLRPDRPDGDTLRYEVYMKDKNGIESNRVTTEDIYILP